MTSLTTPQMIAYLRTWLAGQRNSIPRDMLQFLYDISVALLETDNPHNPPTAIGENEVTTGQLLDAAFTFCDEGAGLAPKEFLIAVKNNSLAMLQTLPKWRCSMFFNKPGGGIESSLAYAHPTADAAFRRYVCDGIRSMGGDTLLFIADMMYGWPDIQKAVDESMAYAVSVGIKHLIVDIRNDNGDVPFDKLEAWIAKLAESYAWANSEQVAFMTCLETSEIMPDVNQCRQAVAWIKRYAPTKRVIVGAQSISYLQALAGTGCELWYEIRTNPFQMSQAIADQYIADLQQIIPYGPAWAGEFWSTVAPFGAYISKRALEIGCQGVGSWAG
jgi:hypothetical protein